MIQSNDKLYIVVRADLKPGAQGAQSLHAMAEFWATHPTLAYEWHAQSNFVCWLEVSDEKRLHKLLRHAEEHGVPHAAFREPWLDNSLTAVALHPTGSHLVREFQLALRI